MKNKLLLLVAAICLLPIWHAQAQYSTPGTGQRYTLTQLAAASGGYITRTTGAWLINDTIRLAATDTLRISTNELIRVADRVLVSVDGVLQVTPPDSVVFTAQNAAAPWVGMSLSSTSTGSVLRRTVVERSGGLRVLDANVELTDCVLRYNVAMIGNRLTNSGALSLSGNRALIQRCRFVRNARAGINSPSNRPTSPIIEECTFLENDTENGNYPQINLGTGNPAFPIRIERCTVIGNPATNMAGGIGVSNLLGGTAATTVIIRRNTVRNNRYGIAVIGSNINSYVTGNVVENNNTNPNAQTGGSGLNFQGNQTQTGVVSRNVLRGNLWGVTLVRTGTVGGPAVSFGSLNSPDTTNVGLNRLTGNGNGGQIYDFYNNTPDAVKAENNDWGTTDVSVIEAHIVHQPDQATLGLVDFQPFREPLSASARSGAAALRAYPNPAHAAVAFKLAGAATARVLLYDGAGRRVLDELLQPVSGMAVLRTQELRPGLYYYQLTQEDAVSTGKLMIE